MFLCDCKKARREAFAEAAEMMYDDLHVNGMSCSLCKGTWWFGKEPSHSQDCRVRRLEARAKEKS